MNHRRGLPFRIYYALALMAVSLVQLQAQEEKVEPYVFNLIQDEAIFEGSLANVPGDFYLMHWGTNTFGKHWDYVEGWFQYRGQEEQVRVSGLFSNDEVMLFTGSDIHDSIHNWRPNYDDYEAYHEERDLWERLDSLDSNQYTWKFRWGPRADQRYWRDGEEEKRFVLFFDQSKLTRSEEYLVWGQRSIPLAPLDLGGHSFEVIAYGDTAILMRYWYISNTYNPMGRCGAGFETGLSLLIFDREGLYRTRRHIPIESCWSGYYNELELQGDRIQIFLDMEDRTKVEYLDLRGFHQEAQKIYDQVYSEF